MVRLEREIKAWHAGTECAHSYPPSTPLLMWTVLYTFAVVNVMTTISEPHNFKIREKNTNPSEYKSKLSCEVNHLKLSSGLRFRPGETSI